MFRMTHDILVFGVNGDKPFKAHSMKWKRSMEDFTDTCTIKLPAITTLKKQGDSYEKKTVQTGLIFKEGMVVEVRAGYDGENDVHFKGFISRINYTIPLQIDCEGYSYQLRKKLDFSKSYKGTTVKQLLNDVIAGTDIKLSDQIPNIPIDKATFQNITGIQLLEWLKQKCLLTVNFNFDVLYVGGFELTPGETKKFRLNWNTVKDSDLKYGEKEFADVRIKVAGRDKDGSKKKGEAGKRDGQVKQMKSYIRDQKTLNEIAERERIKVVNSGYEGSITSFLKPFVAPGMAVQLEDTKYPERTGKYFVPSVEGEFGPSGGRLKIEIGSSL